RGPMGVRGRPAGRATRGFRRRPPFNLKAGRKSEAEAQLWRAFEKALSVELYARLRELGGEAAHERAIAFLEARLAEETRTPWHNPADLLIRVLMHEKMFD